MLPIGLIGAGPDWDSRWKPAILAQSRLKVVSVYDPVAVRAEALARDADAVVVSGAREFFSRGELKGILILDSGWLGSWALREAARTRTPVLVARSGLPFAEISSLPADIDDALVLQPDLKQRYLPSSMRVRELTATQLGPVHFLSVLGVAPPGDDAWPVAELVDWCRFIVQSSVVGSGWEWIEHPSGPVRLLRLLFRRETQGTPVAAEIRLLNVERDPAGKTPALTAEISCEGGVIWIRDSQRLSWRTAEESAEEELSEDRSSAQVQLDLFARRLAGGLVPAGSLEDVRIALRLAEGGERPT